MAEGGERGDDPLCDRNMVHKILCITGFVTVAVHNLFSLSSIPPPPHFLLLKQAACCAIRAGVHVWFPIEWNKRIDDSL